MRDKGYRRKRKESSMFPGKPVKEKCYLLCCYQEEKLLRPRIIASLIRSGDHKKLETK